MDMEKYTVRVILVHKYHDDVELEFTFHGYSMPAAIYRADHWAKEMGYKLVKSPAKIAELFPACHQVACNQFEKVFYVRNYEHMNPIHDTF